LPAITTAPTIATRIRIDRHFEREGVGREQQPCRWSRRLLIAERDARVGRERGHAEPRQARTASSIARTTEKSAPSFIACGPSEGGQRLILGVGVSAA